MSYETIKNPMASLNTEEFLSDYTKSKTFCSIDRSNNSTRFSNKNYKTKYSKQIHAVLKLYVFGEYYFSILLHLLNYQNLQ